MNAARSSVLLRLIPYFILLIMLMPLAAPYLEPGVQFADDRFAPYLRVQALREALADGQIPPRWFAEFDGGYGSPYPSFYAMLFYDVALGFNVLGAPVGAAVELTAFLSIFAAALGMFVLVRSLWGVRSGVLAAALYAYAPYHLVDAFVRGALSELAAFVWFPLVVHTTYQAIITRKRSWLALSGLSIAGLILTHNLMPILFLPVIFGVLGVISLVKVKSGESRLMGVGAVGASGALGLLVSAYFWLPIAFERNLLRLEYFLQYDFHGDFVGRGTLFAWSSSEPPYTSVGLVLLGAAFVGALIALSPRSRSQHKLISLGALAAGLFFLFMTTRRSSWLWEHIPLLPFVQFPWRFLAPASFCLALASGPLPAAFRSPLASWGAAILLGAAIYIQSSPLINIADRIDGASIEAMTVCQEVWGTQDYRPATSHALFWRGPSPPADAAEALVLLPCPAGVSLSSTGKAEVLTTAQKGTRWDVRYSAAGPAVITIPQFFFPGWTAWVDQERMTVSPSSGDGLLQIHLPAGEHSLRVDYHETVVCRVGDVLSLLGLAAVAAISLSARAGTRAQGPSKPESRGVDYTIGDGRLAGVSVGCLRLSRCFAGSSGTGRRLAHRSATIHTSHTATRAMLPTCCPFNCSRILGYAAPSPTGFSASARKDCRSFNAPVG